MIRSNFLFDLDGTLTDPALGITNSVAYALEHYGINVDDRTKLYPFIGPPLTYSFENFYGFSPEKATEAVKYYREYFAVSGIFENELYDGIPEMLEKLKLRGARLILATSKPEEFAVSILKHFGIYDYFDFVAGNTLKETRPEKKDVLAYIQKELPFVKGRNSVMTGDRKYDIEAAKEFGMTTVGVDYGYASENELADGGANFICADVESLTRLLISMS